MLICVVQLEFGGVRIVMHGGDQMMEGNGSEVEGRENQNIDCVGVTIPNLVCVGNPRC